MKHGKMARIGLVLTCAGVLAATAAPAAETLYEKMGGEAALRAVVHEFVLVMESDPRINFTFASTDIPEFEKLLFDQLCELSDGPCEYKGRDMRTSHAELNVTNAQFNALAEDLYIAFERVGISYRLQNKLMAMLAPMQEDIVKE